MLRIHSDGSSVVGIKGTGGETGDVPRRHAGHGIGQRHVEVLIGRGVDIGLVEGHARTEDDTRDAFYGGIELSFTGFLAVEIIDGAMQ